LSFLGREKLLNADCEPQEQAPQPGAAMKGASLLLVLVLAKLAMAWGHASSLTGWSLAGIYVAGRSRRLGVRRARPRPTEVDRSNS